MTCQCFPSSIKCERYNLADFISHYNSVNGTNYEWRACLDVENRTRKEPEGLLEAHGETPIVIERKSVAWPPDYFSSHSREHQIFDLAGELVKHFDDGVYQLTINSDDLKEHDKRAVNGIASRIAQILESDIERAKKGGRSSIPIRWSFRKLGESELDARDIHLKTGVVVVIKEPWTTLFDDAWDQRISTERDGYAEQFARTVEKAAEKFENYLGTDYRRVLLIELYGGDTFSYEDMAQIVERARIPSEIDEVWVESHDWVSDDELAASWVQAFPSR